MPTVPISMRKLKEILSLNTVLDSAIDKLVVVLQSPLPLYPDMLIGRLNLA